MAANVRILSNKADSNTWESFTRSELKLESVHLGSPRSNIFRKRDYFFIWSTIAQWTKVLSLDESEFCISFGNQAPRVWRNSGETQNPCCLYSVKFPQSVMIWAAMSSAGVGPLCFLKSTVNVAVYQEILEHFMLPSTDKFYGDADFIFQQDLAPTHTVKGTKSWFNDHGVTVLDCPANSPDLNPTKNLDERHQTQQCRGPEGRYQSNLGFITPEQCHRLIDSMPRRIDAVIHAKGGPTKYYVHRNEHTFQKPDMSV